MPKIIQLNPIPRIRIPSSPKDPYGLGNVAAGLAETSNFLEKMQDAEDVSAFQATRANLVRQMDELELKTTRDANYETSINDSFKGMLDQARKGSNSAVQRGIDKFWATEGPQRAARIGYEQKKIRLRAMDIQALETFETLQTNLKNARTPEEVEERKGQAEAHVDRTVASGVWEPGQGAARKGSLEGPAKAAALARTERFAQQLSQSYANLGAAGKAQAEDEMEALWLEAAPHLPGGVAEAQQKAQIAITKLQINGQRAMAKRVAGSARPIDNIALVNNGAYPLLPEQEQAQIINSARKAQETVDKKAQAFREAEKKTRVGQIAIDIANGEAWTENPEAVMQSLQEVEATASQVGSIRSMQEKGVITDPDVLAQYRDQIIVEGVAFDINKVLASPGLSKADTGKLVKYHEQVIRGPERQSAVWKDGLELINNFINGLGGPGLRQGRALRQATERETALLRNLLPDYYKRTRGYPTRPGTEKLNPLQLAEDMVAAVDFQKIKKPTAEYLRMKEVFDIDDSKGLVEKVKDGSMSQLQSELVYPIMKQEEQRREIQDRIDAREETEREARLEASEANAKEGPGFWERLFGGEESKMDVLNKEMEGAIKAP